MDFTTEQTEFPSLVHRHIHCAARGLTPLSLSLSPIGDGDLRASCAAYHAFTLDMLADMYENPQAYGLPALELETFLGGRKLNGVKRQQPARTERLRSRAVNAVNGYQVFLCMLGLGGVAEGGALLLPPGAQEAAARRAGGPASPLSLQTRLGALARVGLEPRGDRLVSLRHPTMFPGLCALAASAGEMKSFGYFAFQNLEFRNIVSPYKPVYADYTRPLPAARRAAADAIDAFARSLGARPACNTFWKVDYKYKGMQALCLENSLGDLVVRVTCTYGWDDPALINGRLEAESPEFQRYILRHVWGCTGCSTTHLGAFATILGHRRRVCMGGGIGFRWTNPGEGDLEGIFKCLEFRRGIAEELKGKK